MIAEKMIFAATSDIAGQVRGKSFPAAMLEKRLRRGVGWTPTNVQITCFDSIGDSPYGALGDLLLVPDPAAHVHVDFEDGTPPEDFMLGDIVTLEGDPWECCTRSILKSALARLKAVGGLRLVGAFEHEFHLKGPAGASRPSYSLAGYRDRSAFGSTLMAALDAAGLEADTFMKEFGPDQYEVTIGPSRGVAAADASVILREMIHATARRYGEAASFTPIRHPDGVGNGVHIHFSFEGADGRPATYDPQGTHGMAPKTASFVAGILKYLDAIVAFTAPSAISYLRLTPHRWSAAFNNLGVRDREASVRICPTTARDVDSIARQFNIEYRAADGAASPHLALAAIAFAGAQGIEEGLPAPPATQEDLSLLDAAALAARGYTRLPQGLDEALARMMANDIVRGWFPARFCEIYRDHKLCELRHVAAMDAAARCAAYEAVY
ncbi:glutamine synthetase family protein [Labrys monachus]|uniref:Glutamine synthetase n=1 Tax=Labrys monachus TaxID=217067 RepID=A0ABU0FIM5_9HYPH|nr:glutamine synthetase family protein [Labrys monachus]MDQ0394465.1 glutamine synthetase [Labrys monachus]